MIHLDTSVLVDALTGPRRSGLVLRRLLEGPHPIAFSCIVLYEWLRGPRLRQELEAQEALFPSADAVAFGSAEAAIAGRLYQTVRRPRGREGDLAVAACALTHGAVLWTLNLKDFADIPGLEVFEER